MNRFYEAVVKYDKKEDQTGEIIRISQKYLLDAVSVTDTEITLKNHLKPFVSGEMDITSISLSKYSEFIPENVAISMVDGEAKRLLNQNSKASNEADKYFSAKVSFITVTEGKNAKIKKTPYHYIIFATSVDAANDTLVNFMKGSMADWEINGVVETKIVDVLLRSE